MKTKNEVVDVSPWSRPPDHEVLFDGRFEEGRWASFAAAPHHGGHEMVALRDGALVVEVPGRGAGHAGLLSPQPALWLDDFGDGAEVKLTFRFDAEGTDGFVIVLTAGTPMNHEELPFTHKAVFSWRAAAGGEPGAAAGRAELHIAPLGAVEPPATDTAGSAPATVVASLCAGEIAFAIPGHEPLRQSWPYARNGQGLYLYVYSQAPAADDPAHMVLRGIEVDRQWGPLLPSGHGPMHPQLPVTVLFDGIQDARWAPIGFAGGDFTRFARFTEARLLVDVPAGHSWGKTGLLSVEPHRFLDEREALAPTRLTLFLDAGLTDGLAVSFSWKREAEMWFSHDAMVFLVAYPEEGIYRLTLHAVRPDGALSGTPPWASWSREIPMNWMQHQWDGQFRMDMGHGWMAVSIPNGPVVCGQTWIHRNSDYHMAIISHPPREGASARFALQRIERVCLAPPGLSRRDWWRLVEDAAFDPDDFLRDLAEEINR